MKRFFLPSLLMSSLILPACGDDPKASIGMSRNAGVRPVCSNATLQVRTDACRGPWEYTRVACSEYSDERVCDGTPDPSEGLKKNLDGSFVLVDGVTVIDRDIEGYQWWPLIPENCPDPSHGRCAPFTPFPSSTGFHSFFGQRLEAEKSRAWSETVGKLDATKYADQIANARVEEQLLEFTDAEIASYAQQGFAPRTDDQGGSPDRSRLVKRGTARTTDANGYIFETISVETMRKGRVRLPVFGQPCRRVYPEGTDYGTCAIDSDPSYTVTPTTFDGITKVTAKQTEDGFLDDNEIATYWQNDVEVPPPVCTTHDALPLTTQAQAQAKFNAVSASFAKLEQYTSNATDKTARLLPLVKEVTSLFLVLRARNENLDRPSITRLTEIMTYGVQAHAWCGEDYDALFQLLALPLGSTTALARDAEAEQRASILVSIISSAMPNTPAERVQELRARLRLLGAWHATAQTELSVAMRERHEALFSSEFWAGVYTPEFARLKEANLASAPSAPGTDQEKLDKRLAALDEIFGNDFSGDRQVLLAMFPPPGSTVQPGATLPLEGTLGARFLGVALRGFSERLRAHGYASDFACSLLRTCASDNTPVRSVGNVWRALAALDVKADLQTAAARLPAADEWRTVFEAIAARHPAFLRLVSSSSVFPATRADARPAAREVVNLVFDARERRDSFLKTGTFELLSANTISRSLAGADAQDPALKGLLTGSVAALEQEQANLKAKRDQLLQGLLGELEDKTRQKATRQDFEHKLKQLDELSTRTGAIRRGLTEDSKKFSDFLKVFDASLADADMNQKFVLRSYDRVVPALRPSSSAPANTILSLGPVEPFSLKKGEFLALRAPGTWSPTCALRSVFTEETLGHDPVYAVTGSEGYHLTDSSNSGTSFASSFNISANATVSNRSSIAICSKLSMGGPGFLNFLFGANITKSVETCNQTSFEVSGSTGGGQTWQDSEGTQRSASFSSGIRLPNTPSPLHPAGSLLAFVMPAGESSLSRLIEVRVVERETGMLMQQDADVYLLANDARCAESSGQITVSAARYQTLAQIAQEAGQKMADALTTLRGSAARYEAQGVMLPSEAAALRSAAAVEAGPKLSNMPDVVKSLFTLWIDNEVSRIERLVEIKRLEREQRDLIAAIKALRTAIDDSGTRNLLYAQLTHWRAHALSHEPITDAIYDVAYAYARRLLPVLRLRHPEDLDCIAGVEPAGASPATKTLCRESKAALTALANGSVSGKLEDLADAISGVATDIDDIVESLDAAIATSKRTVAIRFPNPFINYCMPGELPPEDGSCVVRRSDDSQVRTTTLTGNALQSRLIWAALLGRPEAGSMASASGSFSLLPEDLYSKLGVANSLPCNESAPIVSHMALVVGNNGEGADTINGGNYAAQVAPPRQAIFPTTRGAESYVIESPALNQGTFNLPIVSQHYRTAVTFFDAQVRANQYPVNFATTPFTRYDYSIAQGVRTGFDRQLSEAYEVYFVLRVDTLPFSNLSWVPSCM